VLNGSNADGKFKKQGGVIFADEHYFDLFDHTWVAGNKKNALKEQIRWCLQLNKPKYISPSLLTPICWGKQVIYDDSLKTTVTGIIEPFTQNTDLKLTIIFLSSPALPITTSKATSNGRMGNTNSASQLFIKLLPTASPAK
jgi:putative ABC transport system permease protein